MIRAAILSLFTVFALAFQLGQDYYEVDNSVLTNPAVSDFLSRTKGEVKVLQFYNYACGACYYFQKFIEPWKVTLADNVSMTKVPVLFHERWHPFVRTHYVLQALEREDLDKEIFDLLHKKRQFITDPRRLADFFGNYEVEPDRFMQLYASPSVVQAARTAEDLMNAFRLTHIPTFAVIGPKGAYYARPQNIATAPTFTDVVDQMIRIVQ